MLGDGITDAVDEGKSECNVNSTGDLGAVREVEICEVRDHGFDLGFGWTGGEKELGLDCHGAIKVVEVGRKEAKRLGGPGWRRKTVKGVLENLAKGRLFGNIELLDLTLPL